MQKSYLRAIQTKYLPATNSSPARVKAFDLEGHSTTVSWERPNDENFPVSYDWDGTNSAGRHLFAAESLRDKMGWKGELIGAHTKGGMVFVFRPEE